MAKKKREFAWGERLRYGNHILWCDKKHVERIRAVKGVVKVYVYIFEPSFGIAIDPRYDAKDVKAAIEAVIKQRVLPERRREFVWEESSVPGSASLWCDGRYREPIGAVDGVAAIYQESLGNYWRIYFDPCYDKAEVKAAIERIITEGKDD